MKKMKVIDAAGQLANVDAAFVAAADAYADAVVAAQDSDAAEEAFSVAANDYADAVITARDADNAVRISLNVLADTWNEAEIAADVLASHA